MNRFVLRLSTLFLTQAVCFVCALTYDASPSPLQEDVKSHTADTPDSATLASPLTPFPFSIAPTNVGLNLSPFAASLELSFLPTVPVPDARVAVTAGYDRALSAFYGAYASIRYERLERLPLGEPIPTRFSLQVGAWPHIPHLGTVRTTAFGMKGRIRAELLYDEVPLSGALEVGLVQLVGLSPGYFFDGRGELGVGRAHLDRWGYATSGWRGTLTGLWSATAVAPSLALWGDGAYTVPLRDFWRLTFGLRAGYRPAWPLPIVATTDLAVLGTAGVSRALEVGYEIAPELLALERLTLEPRLRIWLDHDLHAGADVTVSLDTLVHSARPVTVSGTLGYTNRIWFRLGLRVSP